MAATLKTDTILATPPVAVAMASFAGMALQDWVYALTITYTLFLIGEKVWKYFKAWQERKIFRAALDMKSEPKE